MNRHENPAISNRHQIFQPTPKQPGDLEIVNPHRPAHRVGGDK